MMFPIRDENPQLQIPYVTYALIALNVIAWLALQGVGVEPTLSASVCQYGLIPADLMGNTVSSASDFCDIDGKPDWHTTLTSIFMHGSWMHLLGNMWFLWIFGNNVEEYALFRFTCCAALLLLLPRYWRTCIHQYLWLVHPVQLEALWVLTSCCIRKFMYICCFFWWSLFERLLSRLLQCLATGLWYRCSVQ